MKYIVLSDINYLFKKNIKLIIFTMFIFLFYAIYLKKYVFETDDFIYYIGLIIDKKYIALISLFLFDYVICIYINCSIYINGLRVGYDYLFTRMNYKKWNLHKIISIVIVTLLIKIIQMFIYMLIFNFGITINNFFHLFLHLLIILNISLSIIYSYLFRKWCHILFAILYGMFIYFSLSNMFTIHLYSLLLNIITFLINLKIISSQSCCDIKIVIGGLQ